MNDDQFLAVDCPVIPEISDERLESLMKEYTPLIQRDGKLNTFDIPDLRKVSYTWGPQNLKPIAGSFIPKKIIHTSHNCGYYGLFKPSIAGVLAYVEDDWSLLGNKCNAFYINVDEVKVYRCGGGYRATTIFGVLT